ncbi:MAG: GumC family protein [Acidobacteriota bacterium]
MTNLIKPNVQPGPHLDQELSRQDFKAPSSGVSSPFLEKELNLAFLLRACLNHKRLILLISGSIFILAALVNFSMTPLYRSSTTIRIQPKTGQILPYEGLYESSRSFLETEAYLETQCEILRSETIARRVVDRLNLAREPDFVPEGKGILQRLFRIPRETARRADLSQSLIENLGIEPIGRSRVIRATYVSINPQLAAGIINAVVGQFMEFNRESRHSSASRATEFIQSQASQLKERIQESEKQLVEYVRDHGLVTLDESNNIVVQRLSDLNARRTQVETDLILKQAHYTEIQEATPEELPAGLKTSTIVELENRVFQLNQRLANLLGVHGRRWPEVMRTEEEIREVEQQLQQEKGRVLKEAVRQAKMDYLVALHSYQSLMRALEEQKQVASRFNKAAIQYSVLRREVETSKQVYAALSQRMKEAGVAAGLNSVDVQVIDPGRVPPQPFRPRTSLNLALGLLLGLMCGFGAALAIEYSDQTLRTPEQVEAFLQMRCLGLIPTVTTKRGQLKRRPSSSGGAGPQLESSRSVLEAYKSLRTSVLLSRQGGPPQTILVTSALLGEGKTTTTVNLGIVLAQMGAPTLIVDLDLRKPGLDSDFDTKGTSGLTSFLNAQAYLSEQIVETAVPNLYLLPTGPLPANPAELVASERMGAAFGLLREHFRYIVMDTSPVLSFTDTLILSPHADGVVLVLHGGRTHPRALKRAVADLRMAHARLLGSVINNVQVPQAQESEYYGYYPIRSPQAQSIQHLEEVTAEE